jgi:hypothetical protein
VATEVAEWRPLTELRHRVDQMFRDVVTVSGTTDGVVEVTIPLPKDEAKKVVEVKATDGASANGGSGNGA